MNANVLRTRWTQLDVVPSAEYPDRMVHHDETRRLFERALAGDLRLEDDADAPDFDPSFDPFGLWGSAA